jgi:hypothetical protein
MLVAALSILLVLILMEALKPLPAIVGAKLMALWRAMCSNIGLYYKSHHESRYIAISWEPRLMLVAALSRLSALPLVEALKPVQAIVGAKIMALWGVMCSSSYLYYK